MSQEKKWTRTSLVLGRRSFPFFNLSVILLSFLSRTRTHRKRKRLRKGSQTFRFWPKPSFYFHYCLIVRYYPQTHTFQYCFLWPSIHQWNSLLVSLWEYHHYYFYQYTKRDFLKEVGRSESVISFCDYECKCSAKKRAFSSHYKKYLLLPLWTQYKRFSLSDIPFLLFRRKKRMERNLEGKKSVQSQKTLFFQPFMLKRQAEENAKKYDVLMVVLNQACTQPHTNLFNIICPHLTL